MIGYSIIPPMDKLRKEYKKHMEGYDWYNDKGHTDDGYLTDKEIELFQWHRKEMEKLKIVLDALSCDSLTVEM